MFSNLMKYSPAVIFILLLSGAVLADTFSGKEYSGPAYFNDGREWRCHTVQLQKESMRKYYVYMWCRSPQLRIDHYFYGYLNITKRGSIKRGTKLVGGYKHRRVIGGKLNTRKLIILATGGAKFKLERTGG